jgi:hypothetical protein
MKLLQIHRCCETLKTSNPIRVFVLIIMKLVSGPCRPHFANQCPTKYHIYTGSSAHSEIKQHIRGDVTDVRDKQNVKSTARFIKLSGLNAYI